jgi:hypothetical protein
LPLHLIEHERDLVVIRPEQVLKSTFYLNFYRQPYYSKVHQAVVKVLTDLPNSSR